MSPLQLSPDERQQLNRLIAQAMADTTICHRLLTRDTTLAKQFGISEATWQAIQHIQASSLKQFCQQLNAQQVSTTATSVSVQIKV